MSESEMPTRLDSEVAIVTGGGRGIGRAIAGELAAAGARVAVVARSADEVAEMGEEVERRMGPVDLLVNSGAAGSVPGPAWEVDPDAWWRGVEVNVRGSFLATRAVLPGMVARGRGRVVNVASLQAVRPYPYGSGYGASKAAVLRFTDSLA